MKRKILMLSTIVMLMATVSLTSCKQEEEKPKFNYGIVPEEKAPQEAYTAFFCVALGLVILGAIGLKKLKKK